MEIILNQLNKTVTSIVLNNFKNDSRVLKENICFKKPEYDVKFYKNYILEIS